MGTKDVGGTAAIARRLGIPARRVEPFLKQSSFPKPVGRGSRGRQWKLAEVERWYATKKTVTAAPGLIGISEVAGLIGMSTGGAKKRTEKDDFPAPIVRHGRARRWDRDAVAEWWQAHKAAAGRKYASRTAAPKSPNSQQSLFTSDWPEAVAAERLGLNLFDFRDAVDRGEYPSPDFVGGPGWGKTERIWHAATLAPLAPGGGK